MTGTTPHRWNYPFTIYRCSFRPSHSLERPEARAATVAASQEGFNVRVFGSERHHLSDRHHSFDPARLLAERGAVPGRVRPVPRGAAGVLEVVPVRISSGRGQRTDRVGRPVRI